MEKEPQQSLQYQAAIESIKQYLYDKGVQERKEILSTVWGLPFEAPENKHDLKISAISQSINLSKAELFVLQEEIATQVKNRCVATDIFSLTPLIRWLTLAQEHLVQKFDDICKSVDSEKELPQLFINVSNFIENPNGPIPIMMKYILTQGSELVKSRFYMEEELLNLQPLESIIETELFPAEMKKVLDEFGTIYNPLIQCIELAHANARGERMTPVLQVTLEAGLFLNKLAQTLARVSFDMNQSKRSPL